MHIGQLVECIDDTPQPLDDGFKPDLSGLTMGRIYTVRWLGEFTDDLGNTFESIRVEEIVRPLDHGRTDLPYFARRFRPVNSKRLDVFLKLLQEVEEAA